MNDIDEISLKTLLEHAHIGVVIHKWDTSIVYANPTALKLLRLTYEQIIGKDSFDPQWNFLDDAGKKLLIEDYPVNKVKESGRPLENEILGVIDSSREDITWFMINAYFEGQRTNGFIVVTFNDISDTKQIFSFKDIVENTQDIVVVTEAENIEYPAGPKIVYVNRAFEELTGYDAKNVIGETPRILQGALTSDESKKRIRLALQNNAKVSETLLNYDIKGRPYWLDMRIFPLKNKYDEVTHFAAIERDISESIFQKDQLLKRNQDLKALKENLESLVEQRTLELQKAKAQLEKIAFFDPLTNIPNRRLFIDQANKLIKFSERRGLSIAFGLIDLDNFKLINDNHGHELGDLVLVDFAQTMSNFFRAEDIYCRYGGEEFAFAISISDATEVTSLADRLISEVRKIQVESDKGVIVKVTASIGIRISEVSRTTDLENEMKQADIAMYQAKRQGKDRYQLN